jgi:saccharopine dehydrogenase-like NADP-dependent oxidoreductase
MENILVLGSGKMGMGIAHSLIDSGDYAVALGDADADALDKRAPKGADALVVDAAKPQSLEAAMSGRWVVINALPYFLNAKVATAARAQGLHYFDLSEDISVTRQVREIAEGAGRLYAPQCGLAPGFVSIVAHQFFWPQPAATLEKAVKPAVPAVFRRVMIARDCRAGTISRIRSKVSVSHIRRPDWA